MATGTEANDEAPFSRAALGAVSLSVLAACSAPVAEAPAAPAPAQAQDAVACDFRNIVLKRLAEGFAEQVVGGAISSAGALVEVLAAHDGSTWSIIVTRPDGWTCLVASGEDWRRLRPEALGLGA